jgi:hypothetical protein
MIDGDIVQMDQRRGKKERKRERKEKKILKPPRPHAGFENLTFLGVHGFEQNGTGCSG